jgi:hypothetical protein
MALAAGMLTPDRAVAQLTSDQVPRARTVPAREGVKQEMERSRLRLGPIRVTPLFEVSHAGYEDNVFGASEGEEKISDWSATIEAGGRFLLPMGPKLFLKGEALPGYVWYRELSERRTVIGTYQSTLLALFNRISAELTASRSESFAYFSSETDTRVLGDTRRAGGKLEIEVTPVVSLFAGTVAQRQRYERGGDEPEDFVDVTGQDRDEAAARGGLRLRFSESFDLSAAVEGTRTEFDRLAERDNESVAYLAGIHYDRPRFFLNVVGGYREGRAHNDSLFPEYRTATGSYFASYFLTPKVELRVYGKRQVAYSTFGGSTYFFETRNGGGLNFEVLRRLLLRGYAEFGENDYPLATPVGEDRVERKDDVTTYGGGFSLRLLRNAVLTASADRSDYSSNSPVLDRSIVRFSTSISFQGEFTR